MGITLPTHDYAKRSPIDAVLFLGKLRMCHFPVSLFLLVCAIAGAQFVDDFVRRLARRLQLVGWEGNGPYARVAASAVALTNLGEVLEVANRPQGLEPTETLVRKLLLLSPTE